MASPWILHNPVYVMADRNRRLLVQKKPPLRTESRGRIEFSKLSLAEKKLVAAGLIDRILLWEV